MAVITISWYTCISILLDSRLSEEYGLFKKGGKQMILDVPIVETDSRRAGHDMDS